ncbi:CCR4-NOT transcription complex subunit 3-like [Convolutriloba macropyga]|uniref:CCR4-NOT transcription complex subunit 3-like n=1 Tax=Convolutriloba macropyga TaxID=536237 RepID=UPI003F51AE6B
MGDKRKLQAEIDRCLKRVHEGTADFDEIWQKVQNATNTNQKEKFEADLKKEIKKLQRLRDQIKTWMQSNDIKDKRPLMEARKLIETHMERFKVMERDTKTKAYSKEGLGKEAKVDPREQAKEEMSECLSEMVDQLNLEVEQFEAEVEQLKSRTNKKKDKDKAEKVEELGGRITKHRFYITKMEMLKRMLENDSVEPDDVRNIEDTLKDYIERSREPDFVEDECVFETFDFEITPDSIPASGENFGSGISNSSKNDDDESAVSSQITSPSPRKGSSSSAMSFPSSSNQSNNKTTTASPATVNVTPHNTSNSSASSNISTSSSIQKPTAVKPTVTTTTAAPTSPGAITTSIQSVGPANLNKLFSSAPSQQTQFPGGTQPPTTPNSKSSSMVAAGTGYSAVASSNTNAAGSQGNSNDFLSAAARTSTVTPTLFASTTSGMSKTTSSASSERGATPQTAAEGVAESNGTGIDAFGSISSGNVQPGFQMAPSLSSQFSTGSSDVDNLAASTGGSTMSNLESEMSFATAASNNTAGSVPASTFSSYQTQLSGGHSYGDSTLNKELKSGFQHGGSYNFPHNSASGAASAISHGGDGNTAINSFPFSSGSAMPLNLSSGSTTTGTTAAEKSSYSSAETPSGLSPGDIKDSIGNMSVVPDTAYLETLRRQDEQYRTETNIPPLLGVAPLGPVKLGKEHVYQQNMLEAAFEHLPHASDSERLRPYLPRNPCPTPNYYPKEPLPNSDTVDFFERLATETLFFIFYYLEGTEAQYLAAKALKKQSWRFHTKYMMWFQRHEEPKQITDDCEMGSYIYFDYEKWTQRRKEGFTFEYRFLEDRDLK